VERLCHELRIESTVRVGDPIDGEESGASSNRPLGSSILRGGRERPSALRKLSRSAFRLSPPTSPWIGS
jgi:hypothetical protein